MTTKATKTTVPGNPAWIPGRLYRIPIDQYERMAEEGVLGPRDRVLLIDGLLVDRMTQNFPHHIADELLGLALSGVVPPDRYHVVAAKPIRLPRPRPDHDSMPEPDRSVVRGPIRAARRTPAGSDLAMVAEVADSSLAGDRDYAANLYGPAGIPTCWIVDLNGRRIEVYTGPEPWGYTTLTTYAEGQSVPVVLDGLEVGRIAVADVLPSPTEEGHA